MSFSTILIVHEDGLPEHRRDRRSPHEISKILFFYICPDLACRMSLLASPFSGGFLLSLKLVLNWTYTCVVWEENIVLLYIVFLCVCLFKVVYLWFVFFVLLCWSICEWRCVYLECWQGGRGMIVRFKKRYHVKLVGVGVRHVCMHCEMSLAWIAVLIEASFRRCGVDVCAWLILW